MSELSPVYQRMAENYIAGLHVKCTRGIFSERLFRLVADGDSRFYPLEKLEWMKDFLSDPHEQIAAWCLECLCRHGYSLDEARDVIASRLKDRIFSNRVIDIAERMNNPGILLLFTEEEDAYVNRVIVALKNTGNESYLTTLMLSNNDSLVKALCRITK